MLHTIRDIRIFGGILVLILAAFLAAAYLDAPLRVGENQLEIGAYFFNPATNSLEREERVVTKGSNKEMIAEALNEVLLKGPKNKSLAKTIPDFLRLQEGEFLENRYQLQLSFSTDGQAMTAEEELIFKSSLCWTLTELPMISDLHIYIDDREMLRADGEPIGLINRNNTKIGDSISPFLDEVNRITLYFANDGYTGLLLEERVIKTSTSSPDQNKARSVIEQLIQGPSRPDRYATITPETRIREVNTEGDICYINLSAEALSKSVTADGDPLLMIYSLVNSLTELEGIKKVQFLIDSKKPEAVNGGYDLSLPLERNENLIITEYR